MRDGIRQTLADLDTVRENLLAYADDAWLNIDRRDRSRLGQGIQYVTAYDEKIAAFSALVAEISEMIQQREGLQVSETIPVIVDQTGNERIIRELDTATPHSLNENFAYKRPYGFILEG